MTGPVVVTGPAGNVGAAVCAALHRLGVEVRRAERPSFDFMRPETFEPLVRGATALFLLRPPPIGDVASTLNVLVDRALDGGVGHVVFLSVLGVERMKWVPHAKVEAHLASRKVPTTLLRAGFFMQNLETAYREDIQLRGELYVPAGDGRVSFVDARDLGEAAARCIVDNTLGAFDVVGPERLTFADVAALLSTSLGRPIRYRAAVAAGYALHLRRQKLPLPQIAVQTILHVGLRKGDADATNEELAKLLGRAPTTMKAYIDEKKATWL